MQGSLDRAIAATETFKTAMRREEEHIRTKVAETLALTAEERQAKVEIAFAKSCLVMTTNLATDLFVQAREKIRQTQAQRNLINQKATNFFRPGCSAAII